MTCYHPIPCWVSKKCNPRTGKSVVVFSAPSNIKDFRSIYVPCGQCIGCKLDYSRSWALRCVHEAQLHEKNCFVTLTYDDEHVPWSSKTGEQTLVKKDLQKFMKSLRKAFPDIRIRFFGCGEYGDETYRPHYHVILFGFDFSDKRFYKLSSAGFRYYISDKLDSIWKRGQCMVADVNYDTCAYVARYCTKKLSGAPALEKYEGIEKEFVNMSRRPGIGKEWFDKYKNDVFPYDECVVIDGQRPRFIGTPRYYDNLYEQDFPDEFAKIREKRIEKAEKFQPEVITKGRMEAKEKIKNAQIKSLKGRNLNEDF